jgi:hypothetical protein
MREHQRTGDDGWTNLGSIGDVESGQAHQVWWHRQWEEGRLWPYVKLEGGGVQPKPFEPKALRHRLSITRDLAPLP